jgi:DNA-binding NtrC family response regulator
MRRTPFVVLVADPDLVTCEIIAEMLKLSGHAVTAITKLVSGLRVLDTILFDALVVSVDDHPSVIDLSFLKAAKAGRPMLKVVGMSAQIHQPADGTAHLMDAFLHKPFSLEQLNEAVDRVLSGKTANEAASETQNKR